MPDRRSQRGPHPKDLQCFTPEELPRLRAAVEDLSWLRSRGYSSKTAVMLVGDRYSLRDRQRRVLHRCAASPAECARRRDTEVEPTQLAGEIVLVDGYNVLLTIEAALSGGVLLLAKDGVLRDLAAMSRHFRRVDATRPAVDLLAGFFREHNCARVDWLLDRPVSNSGRLKRLIEDQVAGTSPEWRVELADGTDRRLSTSSHIVVSADSRVLDRSARWANVARPLVERRVPDAWIVDLS